MDKKLYAQRLSEQIGTIDDRLLREAQGTDSPEKLRKLRRGYVRPRRLAWAAACLALAICLGVMIPMLSRESHALSDVDIPEWFAAGFADTTEIDSLHKINYYGGLLAAANDTVDPSDTPLLVTPGVRLMTGLAGSAKTGATGQIDRFGIDPNEVFTVTRVIAFQLELNNPDNAEGFLESVLGEGVIDVVVTENNLETMITFRQGEAYYSCLLNGISDDKGGYSAVDGSYTERDTVRYNFSTHKYIEGFDIVKNTEQLNFSFYFWMDRKTGEIVDFACYYSGDGVLAVADALVPDTATVITGSTFTSNLTSTFTVGELQERFGTKQ
ncbi:MAG: hypothetical protein IJY12_04205 [Clostridia bacterium]|nr:hypothetical protein [Clostridia bacterium]